jgi:adenosylhomocysteine nucleosidase
MALHAASTASPDEPLTAIVAAMEEEVAGVRARLVGARSATVVGARVTLGRLGAARVALAVTGDGARHARIGLSGLLAAQPVSRIVVVGVAGGLSATLDVGALVIADRILDEADGSVYPADAVLVESVAAACGARRGVVVTATRIADSVEEKRRLLALATAATAATATATTPTTLTLTPAATAATTAVVDLESAVFAAIARRAQLPWVVLRAVSDTAADALPALLNQSRHEDGAVRRSSVVWGLLTQPRALLPLLALRERVSTCAGHLADAVDRTMVALGSADHVSARSTAVTFDAERADHAVANQKEHNVDGT